MRVPNYFWDLQRDLNLKELAFLFLKISDMK